MRDHQPHTLTADERIGVPRSTAARIANIPEHRLARWERYGLVVPRSTALSSHRAVRTFDFGHLVELGIIRELENRDHGLRQIKRAVERLRERELIAAPLRELHWASADGEILWQYPDGSWSGDRAPGQSVLVGVIDLDEIRASVRRYIEDPRAENEVGNLEHRRATLGSKAVFAGTRTPLAAVHAYLRRGYPDAAIIDAFPHLRPADIDLARETLTEAV